MIFLDTIRDALKSLMSNRLRSFLSMLGIIIGVGAVIAVIAISSGAEKQVLDRLNNLGTNLITISPGVTRGNAGQRSRQVTNIFTYDMAKEMEDFCPSVTKVTPYIDSSGLAVYESVNMQGRMRATEPDFFDMVDLEIESGRMFTEAEMSENQFVVVLGSEIAEELFSGANPLGKSFKMSRENQNYSFTVVGVLKEKGQVMFSNYDNQIFLPLSTYMSRLNRTRYVDGFTAQAISSTEAATAVQQLEYLFYQKFGKLDTFNVMSQTEMLSMASDYTRTFKILLSGIASIALLVGGIGIMNITLVSVTERTREIGIRKALGAKRHIIWLQFLIESCTISLSGGLIGLLFGVAAGMIISRVGGWPFYVTPVSAVIAIGFSTGIGLFFGIYPASRAAKLDPVNALSYE